MTEQTQAGTESTEQKPKRRRSRKPKAEQAPATNGEDTASAAEEVAAKKAAAKKAEQAARNAVKEAEKAAAKAEREAERAKKKAEKEAEKAKKAAEQEKVKESAFKSLAKIAREANAKFASEERAEKRADDQRLGAAILIAEAKEIAREAKIPFKPWCEENLHFPPKEEGGEPRKLSYETVRKLLPIGEAESANEGDGMKMLEDMRASNAAANREARARKREEAKKDKTPEEEAAARKEKAQKALDELETEEFTTVLNEQAKTAGYKVVEDDDESDEESANITPIGRAEIAFGRLRGKTKTEFAKWVCEQMGWAPAVDPEEVEEEVEIED